MVDKLTVAQRSVNMSRIRSKGMKPEMRVRRLVHGLGYRYRLHRSDLPGKPDIVFPKKRKVIFVHGCFWHQHSDRQCLDGRFPKSNSEYWNAKLKRNIARDQANREQLVEQGWKILTIWECETDNELVLANQIREFLDLRI